MAFNRLVWTCLLHGTSHSENKAGLRIEPQKHERVLFFNTDCIECRKAFDLTADAPMSDLLIYYRAMGQKPVIVLAELKGSDVPRALKQIESTFKAVQPQISPRVTRPRFLGLVVSSGGSPKGKQKLQKQMINSGIQVRFASGVKGAVDLREYLN